MSDTGLPEYTAFAEHLRQGQLCFPRCRDCGQFHWYPKPACPHCQSSSIDWQGVAGPGEIFSYTIVRHAFDEKWRGALPYIVALVTFRDAPGVRLVTNLVGVEPPESLRIGAAVQPIFPVSDTSETRVLFRLVDPLASRGADGENV